MNNEVEIDSTKVEFVTKNGVKINGLANIDNQREIHYLIYKVTNLVNGMYYIGQHQTKNPCDEYMGSGLLLENAKNKYGIEKFVKTIMFDFASREEMLAKEIELVQSKDCYHNNPMCYNLATGGQGGNLGPEVSKRISIAVSGEKNGMYGKKLTKKTLKKISDKLRGHPNYTHKGWHQTSETKRKISESHIGITHTEETKQKIRNLVLGRHWYNNGIEERQTFICPNGWTKGRLKTRKPQ